MTISYKKLWKLLIDRDLKKKDLITKAGISGYTLNKLNKGETVTTETLAKICQALGCTFDDIMEKYAAKELGQVRGCFID